MSDKTEQISIAELGARFAQIRKKMKLTQKDVGDELGLPQKKVSAIENGVNVLSSIFMPMFIFYTQFVSADALLDKNFDVEDPKLFSKDYAANSVAKAMVQMLKDEIQHAMDEKKEDFTRRLTSIENYL